MSINNLKAFTGALWDWGILRGCFGGSISPSDIDGMVERNGHFLYLEAKGRGVPIKYGQELAIKNRVRDGLSTFVVVWGDPGTPEGIRVYYPAPCARVDDHARGNLGTLRGLCERWYRYANDTRWPEALAKAADTALESPATADAP